MTVNNALDIHASPSQLVIEEAHARAEFPLAQLCAPDIRLHGQVNDAMLDTFIKQLSVVHKKQGPVLVELTTLGGDAEIGERIAESIRLAQEHFGMQLYFLGMSTVYSAGITVMSAFPAPRRFLSQSTSLLIHERRMDQALQLTGPLRICEALVQDALAEVKASQRMQNETFERLIAGTDLSVDTVLEQVTKADWYLTATEAVRLRLVAGLV